LDDECNGEEDCCKCRSGFFKIRNITLLYLNHTQTQ
jgi:hypothetical protein